MLLWSLVRKDSVATRALKMPLSMHLLVHQRKCIAAVNERREGMCLISEAPSCKKVKQTPTNNSWHHKIATLSLRWTEAKERTRIMCNSCCCSAQAALHKQSVGFFCSHHPFRFVLMMQAGPAISRMSPGCAGISTGNTEDTKSQNLHVHYRCPCHKLMRTPSGILDPFGSGNRTPMSPC